MVSRFSQLNAMQYFGVISLLSLIFSGTVTRNLIAVDQQFGLSMRIYSSTALSRSEGSFFQIIRQQNTGRVLKITTEKRSAAIVQIECDEENQINHILSKIPINKNDIGNPIVIDHLHVIAEKSQNQNRISTKLNIGASIIIPPNIPSGSYTIKAALSLIYQ